MISIVSIRLEATAGRNIYFDLYKPKSTSKLLIIVINGWEEGGPCFEKINFSLWQFNRQKCLVVNLNCTSNIQELPNKLENQ